MRYLSKIRFYLIIAVCVSILYFHFRIDLYYSKTKMSNLIFINKTHDTTSKKEHSFKYRDQFIQYMTRNYTYGRAAEIGVYDGDFAEHNLEHFKGNYIMVDVNLRPKLKENLGKWRSRNITFFQNSSLGASKQFKNAMFDWIYIDAGHDFNDVLNDMTIWYPKLKPGGLFSGHDYCVNKMDLKTTKNVPWCGIFKPGRDYMAFRVFKSTNITGKEKQSFIGVVNAVRLFAQSKSIPEVFFTMEERETLNDDGLGSSWYFFKPY